MSAETSRPANFHCEACTLSFTAKRAFRSHLKTKRHADNAGLAPPAGFTCQYCEQNFTRKEGPIRHLERGQCPKAPNPKRKHSLDVNTSNKKRACVGPRSESNASDDLDEDADSGYGGAHARDGAGNEPSIASSSRSPEDSTLEQANFAGTPLPFDSPRKVPDMTPDIYTPVQLPPLSEMLSPSHSASSASTQVPDTYPAYRHPMRCVVTQAGPPSTLTRVMTEDSGMTATSWTTPADDDQDDEDDGELSGTPDAGRSMSSPELHSSEPVYCPAALENIGEHETSRPLSDALERMSLKNVIDAPSGMDGENSNNADGSQQTTGVRYSRYSLATSALTSDSERKRLSIGSLFGRSSARSTRPPTIASQQHSRAPSLLSIGSRSTMSIDEIPAPFASEVDNELRDARGKGDQGHGRIRRKVFLPSISSWLPKVQSRDGSDGLTLNASNRADAPQWDLLVLTHSTGSSKKGGGVLYVKALQDHDDDAGGALPLRTGDEIQVLPHPRSGNGEWYGVNQNMKKGFFPRRHCAVMQNRLYHPTIIEEGSKEG